MTPADFRTARKALGLSQHALAKVLRMGTWGWQSIGKWENGKVPVPADAARKIEGLLAKRKEQAK